MLDLHFWPETATEETDIPFCSRNLGVSHREIGIGMSTTFPRKLHVREAEMCKDLIIRTLAL